MNNNYQEYFILKIHNKDKHFQCTSVKNITIEERDIYILGNICNNLIINKSYSGFSIYNTNLEKIRDIIFFQKIVPQYVYYKSNCEEILIYNRDDYYLILVEIKSGKCKKIIINQDIIFSGLYVWVDKPILFSFDYKFYTINFDNLCIQLYAGCIKKDCEILYKLSLISEQFRFISVDQIQGHYILKNEVEKRCRVYNNKGEIIYSVNYYDYEAYGFRLLRNIFLSVSRNSIEFFYRDDHLASLSVNVPYEVIGFTIVNVNEPKLIVLLRNYKKRDWAMLISFYINMAQKR